MLYLKYRPQTINELDLTEVRERLSLILAGDGLSHAFLLTGPKGTGKTSTARIIAKSINCENNKWAGKTKSFEPCNKCSNCISINKGSSLDVVEIDAASNRRIDDIRELNATINFSPISLRYKVYIIDEVHMLTPEAFNAVLKTLEEPPLHAIFILATTESHKLPKTIISRCVEIQFSKASQTDLVRSMHRVCAGEKVPINDDILKLIATHADFSFRDAHKILDEVLASENTTLDAVKKQLGLSLNDLDLLSLIEKNDPKAVIHAIEKYEQSGGNFTILIESLLQTLQQLLLKQNGIVKKEFKNLTYSFSLNNIIKLMKLFTTAYKEVKYSPIEAIPLEIAVVEYFAEIE